MTTPLYKTLDGDEITLDQIASVCSEATNTINGALLMLRVCGENGDEDTIALCNAMTVLLKHVDKQVDGIWPDNRPLWAVGKASLPDEATTSPGPGEGSIPSNPQGKNGGCHDQPKQPKDVG